MLNRFGVSVAAASGIGLKVNTFAGMPGAWSNGYDLGQALSPILPAVVGAIYFYRKGWRHKTFLHT